jgi:hypothetical protein
MKPYTSAGDTPDGADAASSLRFSAEACAEWTAHVEHVLRGIAHALNNRAAAVSAVLELSQEPAEEASVVRSILATELERLRDLAGVVRLVGAPREGAEAFAPRDASAQALAVLAMHAAERDSRIVIDAATAPPIRVPRWMFVRALVALAVGVPFSRDGARSVTLTAVEDGEWLVVQSSDGDCAPSPLLAELARAMGGEPLTSGRRGFRVPTLAAIRQREGR